MPTILLIRHGENDYVKKGRLAGRLPGVSLNEQGRKQAEQLAQVLAQAPVRAVYSSPLDRTLETAAPIAAAKKLPVIEREGLLELDFGDWQGRTLASLRLRKDWRLVQHHPSLMRFPNGESFAEAQRRVVAELDEISRMHRSGDLVVCVSHSDLIKLVVAYHLGLALDMFQRLVIAPGSITALQLGKGHAMLQHINSVPGLDYRLMVQKGRKRVGKRKK